MSDLQRALFKFVFSQPEYAASELQCLLPAELSERLDWDSLELLPIGFVGERLSPRETDLIFTVLCDGREACFYVVLEHQTPSDPFIALRLLRKMVQIWDAFLVSPPA